MLLLSHIIIALGSIAWTSYLYFRPTHAGLKVSYGLVAATLGSGTWLMMGTGSPLLSSCISGLVYLLVISFGIAVVRHRLSRESVETSQP